MIPLMIWFYCLTFNESFHNNAKRNGFLMKSRSDLSSYFSIAYKSKLYDSLFVCSQQEVEKGWGKMTQKSLKDCQKQTRCSHLGEGTRNSYMTWIKEQSQTEWMQDDLRYPSWCTRRKFHVKAKAQNQMDLTTWVGIFFHSSLIKMFEWSAYESLETDGTQTIWYFREKSRMFDWKS